MAEIKKDQEDLLQKIIKKFYKSSLAINIEIKDVSIMSWNWQQKFLDATVNSDLVKKYPTSKQFTRLFLKKIIEQLEGTQEVHDDFYSHLCVTMKDVADDSYCYRHYLINNETEVITIKETNKMVVNGTTGMRTWEAALLLADWALCHKEVFTNKTILELGSGVGFTGITIGKMCQPHCMYLSDCHPDVMKAIHDNIRINYPDSEVIEDKDVMSFTNAGRTVGAMALDWNSLEQLPDSIVPDVVIGADIVYDPSILHPLCGVLKTLFDRNQHLKVYIASVIRNEETFESFLKCLESMNFTYQRLNLQESTWIEWDQTIAKCLLEIKLL